MSGTFGHDDLRAATVRQIAQLMAAAAITAPKSGGQLFLAGKPDFMETVIADGVATRREFAAWMRARGKERRERIWFRDAEAAEAGRCHLVRRAPAGLVPAQLPLRRLRVRHLRRVPPPHQDPARPVRRPRIHRPRMQPARCRPGYRQDTDWIRDIRAQPGLHLPVHDRSTLATPAA